MKLLLTSLLYIFFSFTLIAQEVNFQKSDFFESNRNEFEVIGEDENFIYTCQYANLRTNKKKYNAKIQIVDKALELISAKYIYTLEKNDIIVKINFIDGKYQVFFERYNNSSKTFSLYASELNPDNKISPEIVEVVDVFFGPLYNQGGKFNITWSEELNLYIASCNYLNKDKMSSRKYVLFIHIDKDFEIIDTLKSVNSQPIPYITKGYNNGYDYTKDGKLFFIKSDSIFFKNVLKNELTVMELPKQEAIMVHDNKFLLDESRDILHIVTLFRYSSESTISAGSSQEYSDGYIYNKVDLNGNEVVESNKHLFSEEMLNSYIEYSEKSRNENQLWVSKISKVNLKDDGNISVILRNITAKRGKYSTTFNSQGSLILDLDNEGNTNWFNSYLYYSNLFTIKEHSEFSAYVDGKLVYLYISYLDEEKKGAQIINGDNFKLNVINIDNLGNSKKSYLNIPNQFGFINEDINLKDNRIILSAYEHAGVKMKSFLIKIKL